MVLVDHPLGHRRRGEGEPVPLDELPEKLRARHPHG
jgi:hypothetical protein